MIAIAFFGVEYPRPVSPLTRLVVGAGHWVNGWQPRSWACAHYIHDSCFAAGQGVPQQNAALSLSVSPSTLSELQPLSTYPTPHCAPVTAQGACTTQPLDPASFPKGSSDAIVHAWLSASDKSVVLASFGTEAFPLLSNFESVVNGGLAAGMRVLMLARRGMTRGVTGRGCEFSAEGNGTGQGRGGANTGRGVPSKRQGSLWPPQLPSRHTLTHPLHICW